MDEKKLNEEDIINGLRCMAGQKACDLCKYNDLAEQGEGTCMNFVAEDTIELISEQKAEIERLTEENKAIRINCENARNITGQMFDKNDELQKQVDELKSNEIYYETRIKNLKEAYHQAEKDTVKKVADWLDNEKGYCGLGYLVKKQFGGEVK